MKVRILFNALIVLFVALTINNGCASSEQGDFVFNDASIDHSYIAAGGASNEGSCNPQFCSSTSSGKSCCVTTNGPCGIDFGLGCVINKKD